MPSHSTPPARPAKSATIHTADAGHKATSAALALGALGVVFGDIGTSPLYTLKECMTAAGGAKAGVEDLFGILSLMFWALVMVVTVKYLTFVMRAENQGEGGIFALLAIVPERFRATAARSGRVTGMALLAVIGAALLYGDGVITPAISVLSAVEGLAIASPRFSPIVVPLTGPFVPFRPNSHTPSPGLDTISTSAPDPSTTRVPTANARTLTGSLTARPGRPPPCPAARSSGRPSSRCAWGSPAAQ